MDVHIVRKLWIVGNKVILSRGWGWSTSRRFLELCQRRAQQRYVQNARGQIARPGTPLDVE